MLTLIISWISKRALKNIEIHIFLTCLSFFKKVQVIISYAYLLLLLSSPLVRKYMSFSNHLYPSCFKYYVNDPLLGYLWRIPFLKFLRINVNFHSKYIGYLSPFILTTKLSLPSWRSLQLSSFIQWIDETTPLSGTAPFFTNKGIL